MHLLHMHLLHPLTKECSFENEPNQIQNETGTDAAAAAAAFAAAHT